MSKRKRALWAARNRAESTISISKAEKENVPKASIDEMPLRAYAMKDPKYIAWLNDPVRIKRDAILEKHGAEIMAAPIGRGYKAGKNMLVWHFEPTDEEVDLLFDDLEAAGFSEESLNLYDDDDTETFKDEVLEEFRGMTKRQLESLGFLDAEFIGRVLALNRKDREERKKAARKEARQRKKSDGESGHTASN